MEGCLFYRSVFPSIAGGYLMDDPVPDYPQFFQQSFSFFYFCFVEDFFEFVQAVFCVPVQFLYILFLVFFICDGYGSLGYGRDCGGVCIVFL